MISTQDFPVPIDVRYFEDYVPGSVFESGSLPVEAAEVINFAKRYDNQALHTDPETAARGPFGGFIASGWPAAGLMMLLFTDHYLSKVASVVPPGVDELRWTKPVRPGDRLSIRVSILESRRSRSNPYRGMVHSRVEVLNQDREVVMSLKAVNILLCREPL